MSQFSPELDAAIAAMSKITSSDEMAVLADRFNRHITFIGKQKAASIVKGDVIAWEYGGLTKHGEVVKVNRKTIEVIQHSGTPFGSTRTRLDKSMIVGKVAA